ncbi:MAG: tetratricopeptide repeat protein, partial [Candidatus Aenigmatarchaeota archaeon]
MQTDFDRELQSYFTDVEHLRKLFKDWLAAPELPKRMLIIHGVGGVGKSSLLRMFRLHAKSVRVPVALASGDEQKSAAEVLIRWADDLAACDVRLPAFSKTLAQYRALLSKVEDEAAKTATTLAKEAAKTVAEVAVGLIPGFGPVLSKLGGMSAEALADWLFSRGFKKPDVDLLLDPAKKLTGDFLADMAKAAGKWRLVLMLDTFEQIAALSDWTREMAQQLPPNVLLVIAGRVVPDWDRAWPGWMAGARVEELKPMTEADMRELVRRYYATLCGGEPDPKQVEAIIAFARGLPIVVTSAVQLWVKYGIEDFQIVKPEVVANLVDCLMEGVPKDLVPALEAAAIVRWFDQPILRAVMGQEDVRKEYEELRRFPFVRPRAEGLALHDTVREIMDENLRVQDAGRHRELHERAAAYFEVQLEKAKNENQERLLLERVYHRIRVDWQSGIELCVLVVEEATRSYALSFGDLLIKELSDAETLRDFSPHIFYAKGLLSLRRNKFEDAVSLLQKALALQSVPVELKFKATERLAYALTLQGELEEALRLYEECVRLSADTQKPLWQISSWNGIETVLRRLGYINRAIEALHKSIETCVKIGIVGSFEMAWAQDSLGIALGIVGQWKQAVYHHQQALAIYEALGNNYNAAIALHNMTRINHKQGYAPEKIIANFQQALLTFENVGDERWIRYCKLSITETLIDTGRLEEAERAIGSIKNCDATSEIWGYRLLGSIQQYRGEWDKAITSYTKALRLSEHQRRYREKVEFLVRLSSLYLLRGD